MKRVKALDLSMDVVRFRGASGLADVLALVSPGASRWRITHLYATSREGSGLQVVALEKRIDSAELGLELSVEELEELTRDLGQVHDIDLYGFTASSNMRSLDDAFIVVSGVDSTTWEVEMAVSDAPPGSDSWLDLAQQVRSVSQGTAPRRGVRK